MLQYMRKRKRGPAQSHHPLAEHLLHVARPALRAQRQLHEVVLQGQLVAVRQAERIALAGGCDGGLEAVQLRLCGGQLGLRGARGDTEMRPFDWDCGLSVQWYGDEAGIQTVFMVCNGTRRCTCSTGQGRVAQSAGRAEGAQGTHLEVEDALGVCCLLHHLITDGLAAHAHVVVRLQFRDSGACFCSVICCG